MRRVEVRPIGKSDVRALSHVLARAFFEDPVVSWIVQDPRRRRRSLPRMFATMARHEYLGEGGSEVALDGSRIAAAALWSPPGRWQASRWTQLRMLPGFLLAGVFRGQAVEELTRAEHPEEPHWYLSILGSDPENRGGGYAHALLRSRLDRCDAEGAPAYLESSNRDNLGYYERFGFVVTGEMTVPGGGPTLWPMWRAPR